MADKRVQIKLRNAQNEFDNIYPKTKMDLVEGLQAALDKVDKVRKRLSQRIIQLLKTKLAALKSELITFTHIRWE